MGVIWGTPYLLIKVAVGELPPTAIVFSRTIVGALVLLPLAARRDNIRPVLHKWRPLVVFSAIEAGIPWFLLVYAEQELSSSLTGLLIAAVPLVGAVLVWITGHERVGPRRVIGLAIGFGGVAALVGFDVHATGWAPIAAIAGVALCYAIGPLILVRHLSNLPGLGVMASVIAIVAVAYTPVGIIQWPDANPSTKVWLSVIGLGVVCTALAFVIFFALIAEVGPARATVITYVNPAVALLLGVSVLSESVTVITGIGFALILIGCVLATSRDRQPVPNRMGQPTDEAGEGSIATDPGKARDHKATIESKDRRWTQPTS
jgi:drug/metabolite transporter (DMT)-like permease